MIDYFSFIKTVCPYKPSLLIPPPRPLRKDATTTAAHVSALVDVPFPEGLMTVLSLALRGSP